MSNNVLLKHIPEGIGPYDNKEYQRLPVQPVQGDTVLVKALVPSGHAIQDMSLQWTINGMQQEPVKPLITKSLASKSLTEKNDSLGEACCQFNIGSFKEGDFVNYYFEAVIDDLSVKTCGYSFLIPVSHNVSKVKSLWTSGEGVAMEFEDTGDIKPVLKFQFENGHLSTTFKTTGIDKNSNYEPLKSTSFELADHISGHSLYINSTACELEVRSPAGNILLEAHNDGMDNGFIMLQSNNNGNAASFKIKFNTDSKAFYGFGERFDSLNQAGLRPDIYVFEKFGSQGDKTYMPIPFFMTEKGYGLFLNSSQSVKYKLPSDADNLLEISINSIGPDEAFFELYTFFGNPLDIIKAYCAKTGMPALPPKWAFGPWMSGNGWNTQSEALEQVTQTEMLDAPATVMVLEAWSDEATFYIFNDAEYKVKKGDENFKYDDFRFDEHGKWPDPKGMIEYLHKKGIRLVLWQNPVIKHFNVDENAQHACDEAYVIEKGYCVRNADGSPYRIPDNWFCGSLVFDFTNPEASKWWFGRRKYLLEELGVDGFKTDGGEFIYDSGTHFHNGKTGTEMRNLYPVSYISAYHKFIGSDRITFSRAGYTGAQKYPMYWAGDQFSTFEEFRNVLIAGLSSNLSGNPFWGYDIAGFAGEFPSEELYIRSLQTAVFCPVMQFHSEPRSGFNNDRSPWNMRQVTGSEGPEIAYKRYANLRMNLLPYIYGEAAYVSENGEPFMRPLFVDFPEDRNVYELEDEYMFGRSLLIAPVIKEGAVERNVYLPAGSWVDFWTNKVYMGSSYTKYECDTNTIPVFVKSGSVIPVNLNEEFELGGSIGNRIDKYCNLCFMMFGAFEGPYCIRDDLGNSFMMEYKEQKLSVSFSGPAEAVYLLSAEKLSVEKLFAEELSFAGLTEVKDAESNSFNIYRFGKNNK